MLPIFKIKLPLLCKCLFCSQSSARFFFSFSFMLYFFFSIRQTPVKRKKQQKKQTMVYIPDVLQLLTDVKWAHRCEYRRSPGPGLGTCAREIRWLSHVIHHWLMIQVLPQLHTWLHSWRPITRDPLITDCTCFLFTHNQLQVLKAPHSPPFFCQFPPVPFGAVLFPVNFVIMERITHIGICS